MPELQSTNITSADYDDETGVMTVVFRSGGEYAGACPKEVYEGLISAPSPGSYYARAIRNVYPMERM